MANARKPYGRQQSVRGYRRLIDEAFMQLRQGRISEARFKAIVMGAQAGAEMMMAEKKMEVLGLVDFEPQDHPLGEDGGAVLNLKGKVKTFREQRVTTRRGVRGGRLTDITEQQVTGSAQDGDLQKALAAANYDDDEEAV